jgi:hypothetical protein
LSCCHIAPCHATRIHTHTPIQRERERERERETSRHSVPIHALLSLSRSPPPGPALTLHPFPHPPTYNYICSSPPPSIIHLKHTCRPLSWRPPWCVPSWQSSPMMHDSLPVCVCVCAYLCVCVSLGVCVCVCVRAANGALCLGTQHNLLRTKNICLTTDNICLGSLTHDTTRVWCVHVCGVCLCAGECVQRLLRKHHTRHLPMLYLLRGC